MTTAADTELAPLAAALFDAERTARPIPPLTGRGLSLTVDDAYAIAGLNVGRRVAAGASIGGYKIGLTSAAMQQQLGVDQPDTGVLFEEMILADGSTVSVGGLIAPRIEAEIAVVFGSDLRGPGLTAAEVGDCVTAVVPAVEVIDSRIADWKIGLVDTVADNASSARAIAGAPVTGLTAGDLATESVELLVDGAVVAAGSGSALLGDPLRALAWLANRLGELGQSLAAGRLVLAGSVHAAVPFEPGHEYRARYARAGSVSVFAER